MSFWDDFDDADDLLYCDNDDFLWDFDDTDDLDYMISKCDDFPTQFQSYNNDSKAMMTDPHKQW